jgi:hypothetical protein
MRRKCLVAWGFFGFYLAATVLLCAAPAPAQETIKIGAVLPLSKASFAQAGEEQERPPHG